MKAGRPLMVMAVLVALLAVVSLFALSHGVVGVPYDQVAAFLLGGEVDPLHARVIWQIRAPRIVAAALVGSALAASGAAMQGLFRNPMADPGVIGVSAGGALGGVIAITSGLYNWFSPSLPITAFLFAGATSFLVYILANQLGYGSTTDLLLAGMAISAFLGGLISLFITAFVYDLEVMRHIVHWLTGGLENRTWYHVRLVVLPILLGQAALVFVARPLNLMFLGDEEATSLGVRVKVMRRTVLAAASLATGAAVSISGVISFVGLMVPHMLRLVIGPDQRLLVPASSLGGAAFLVAADTLSRLLLEPVEIRVGIITACVGAPFFLFLLYRHRRGHKLMAQMGG